MSKRAAVPLKLSRLWAEASGFSRHAWRGAWAPILLLTVAHTVMFLASHVARTDWAPWPAPVPWLMMILYVPLFGGLYRTALGGRAAKSHGFGGLQWGAVEWRLIIVGAVTSVLTAFALIPALAACGVLGLLLGTRRMVTLGPLGSVSALAVASAGVGVLFFLVMAPRVARLMLGWAYSTARGRTEPFAGLGPARRSGWPIALGLILAWAPLLVGQLGVYALSLVEAGTIEPGAWPLPEAVGAGALLGLIQTALVAPLSVGVLCGAYGVLHDEADEAAQNHGASHLAEAAVAAAAAAVAALEAHRSAVAADAKAPDRDSTPANDHVEADGQAPHRDGVPANDEVDADAHGPAPAAAATAVAMRETGSADLPPPEIRRWYTADTHQTEVAAAADTATPAWGTAPAADAGLPPDASAQAGPETSTDDARRLVGAAAAGGGDASAEPQTSNVVELFKPAEAHDATPAPVQGLGAAATAIAAVAASYAFDVGSVDVGAVPALPQGAVHTAQADGPAVDDPHDAHAVLPVLEALSPWPHSVLPPWPTRLADQTPDGRSPAAVNVSPSSEVAAESVQGEAFPTLAPAGAPDPRIAETTGLI